MVTIDYFHARLRYANTQKCTLEITIPKKTIELFGLNHSDWVKISLVPIKINKETPSQNELKPLQDLKDEIKPKPEQIIPYDPIVSILDDINKL